ncbi:MAG: hypothetical protein UT02_C0005G0012 [Parcubacteria group bacterium GW2011_GWC2_38_7]|nr:MAG: hypothetical protein UT02_C0005G0012 [Parcubacteria group bacterium GW2011_GWC2_38_7]
MPPMPPIERAKKLEKITLPNDPGLQARLEAKLAEYKTRVEPERAKAIKEGINIESMIARFITRTTYKIEVLTRLLETGTVDVEALRKEISERDGDIYVEKEFDTACAVMNDYCENGGRNTVGGTGF